MVERCCAKGPPFGSNVVRGARALLASAPDLTYKLDAATAPARLAIHLTRRTDASGGGGGRRWGRRRAFVTHRATAPPRPRVPMASSRRRRRAPPPADPQDPPIGDRQCTARARPHIRSRDTQGSEPHAARHPPRPHSTHRPRPKRRRRTRAAAARHASRCISPHRRHATTTATTATTPDNAAAMAAPSQTPATTKAASKSKQAKLKPVAAMPTAPPATTTSGCAIRAAVAVPSASPFAFDFLKAAEECSDGEDAMDEMGGAAAAPTATFTAAPPAAAAPVSSPPRPTTTSAIAEEGARAAEEWDDDDALFGDEPPPGYRAPSAVPMQRQSAPSMMTPTKDLQTPTTLLPQPPPTASVGGASPRSDAKLPAAGGIAAAELTPSISWERFRPTPPSHSRQPRPSHLHGSGGASGVSGARSSGSVSTPQGRNGYGGGSGGSGLTPSLSSKRLVNQPPARPTEAKRKPVAAQAPSPGGSRDSLGVLERYAKAQQLAAASATRRLAIDPAASRASSLTSLSHIRLCTRRQRQEQQRRCTGRRSSGRPLRLPRRERGGATGACRSGALSAYCPPARTI